MEDINELNKRRCETALVVQALGLGNTPTKYEDRLKSDAQYRLAQDAADRAEREYRDALAKLSTDDLMTILRGQVTAQDSHTRSPLVTQNTPTE